MDRHKYTTEFKEQAVRLSFKGEKSIAQLAADLGIAANMLYRWRREFQGAAKTGSGKVAFPGQGRARDAELEQLRKALRLAEMERDILKKAAAYFAQHTK